MKEKRIKKLEEALKTTKDKRYNKIETIVIENGEPYTEKQLKMIAEAENNSSLLIIRTII